MKTSCRSCPLRQCEAFLPMIEEEIRFMETFKKGELSVGRGATILSEGQASGQLYTVLSGLGLRHKTLEDGRRQVLNLIFPGDFLGLQAGLMGEMGHSVEATTPMVLCVFDRSALWSLFQTSPARAYDLTWIAAMEEHFLGETVATLGQRDATQRIAWALVRIWRRLVAIGMDDGGSVPFPFRQQDLSDALGLSVVHTNRVIVALRSDGLARIAGRRLEMLDHARLSRLALMDMEKEDVRPIL